VNPRKPEVWSVPDGCALFTPLVLLMQKVMWYAIKPEEKALAKLMISKRRILHVWHNFQISSFICTVGLEKFSEKENKSLRMNIYLYRY
jgi:hypothetical protein